VELAQGRLVLNLRVVLESWYLYWFTVIASHNIFCSPELI
jgi:hypothetical protein